MGKGGGVYVFCGLKLQSVGPTRPYQSTRGVRVMQDVFSSSSLQFKNDWYDIASTSTWLMKPACLNIIRGMYVCTRYSDQIMAGRDSPLAHVFVCVCARAWDTHTHTHTRCLYVRVLFRIHPGVVAA